MKATLRPTGELHLGDPNSPNIFTPDDPEYTSLIRLFWSRAATSLSSTSTQPDGERIATGLAAAWTEREAREDEPADHEIAAAAEALAPLGWLVEYQGLDGWQARPAQSISLSQGGVYAAGKLYSGGEWLSPVSLSSAGIRERIEQAAAETEDPTEAQKESGNYRKGRVTVHGLPITIETPRGTTRRGVGKDGKPWKSRMAAHYGYIRRTESEADGDHVDVFLGPHPESELVVVIDQNKADGAFDEHKCMVGFRNEKEACEAYLASYTPDWKGLGGVTALPIRAFKRWLDQGDTGQPLNSQSISLSTAHAPKGFTKDRPFWIGGKAFVGGQFIPSEVLQRASEEEKAAVEHREPHELTQEEYIESKGELQRPALLKKWHQDAVRKAMKVGQAVPEHVLEQYPTLRPKPKVEAAQAKPTADEMIRDAQAWTYLAVKEEPEDRDGSREHQKHAKKSSLDQWLMKRYGLDEAGARDVSNKAGEDPRWYQSDGHVMWKGEGPAPTGEGMDLPWRKTELTPTVKDELAGKRGGSDQAGLPAGEPVGADAGAPPEPALPGSGEGAGAEPAGVPANADVGSDAAGGEPGGPGDAAGRGARTGDGEAAAETAGRGGPAGTVGAGGEPVEPGASGAAGPHEQSLREEATADNPTDLAAGNFRYTDRDFISKGPKAKFWANIEALKTLRAIEAEGRDRATPAEQEVLSRFIGWGQFPAAFKQSQYDELEGETQVTWQEREHLEETLSPEEFDARFNYDKWGKERAALKSLLNDDEWDAARRSTLNSHFTHPDVVDAHWKIAEKLGFKGGRFLETSAGVGYYLGMMPPEIAGRTRSSAVELDQSTGKILSLLYPKAHTEINGFEKHLAPKGFYDLVASNVPFGNYTVNDPEYNKHRASIHDYFFLKSKDLVRPGGLVMHITSTGTMDKGDPRIRQELAKDMDLVGAIRFPGGAHKENAGTEVVTDMLVLRKRLPGEAPNATTWMETTTVPDPAGGEPIPVNRYFAEHPEQVLGTLDRTGTMYHAGNVNVSRTEDYEQRLAQAIERMPAGVMKPNVSTKAFTPEALPAPGELKDGGYLVKDGKLYHREGGGMVEQKTNAKDLARIQGHLGIRDAVRELFNAQIAGQDASAARAKLNQVYDAYVATQGPLNAQANKRAFRGDPDAPVLLALEKWDPATKQATKADTFAKDTIRSIERATKAGNLSEALGISLHESGGVNVKRMAELTGQDHAAVARTLVEQGIAYEDPSEGWKAADQYLSGNVRRKLTLARAAAAADPRYQPNVDALEKVQPEDIEHTEIEARLGAVWIPPSDVQRFAADVLDARPEHFDVRYSAETGEWQADWTRSGHYTANSRNATEVWGTGRTGFMDLLHSALTGKSIQIRDKDEEGNKVVNHEETAAANAKVKELKDRFKEWVWEDDNRKTRLHRYYNDNYNNIRPISYDGSHLKFPGMNPGIELRDHSRNFVWQVISTGKGLAAHEVGAGKTFAMVAAAMELRRLGLARKPAIACLKANIEAITADARKLYPGAKILTTADVTDAASRKRIISQIATGDYDMVIMTHDHLNALPMKAETESKYVQDEIDHVLAAHDAAVKAAVERGQDAKHDPTVKQLEKVRVKLESKLAAVLSKPKDDALTFENLGIDQLFVDEAHKYKSLPVYSHQDRVKGIPTGRSDRATTMLMRTRWLMEKNGGRGVVFATGTPVANTMAELYTMQRYLQPEELKERGLQHFDAWAAQFGDIETKMEFTVTGEYRPVSRFAKFVNVPELMQMARQMMDVQRIDFLRNKDGSPMVVRPTRHDHVIAAPKSETMDNLMKSLQNRARNLSRDNPKDNMLVICTDGRKGALDMRLLNANAPDDPQSKTNLSVQNILKLHKERPGQTQLIFSDVGVNPIKTEGEEEGDDDLIVIEPEGKEAFHWYGDVIDKLVAGGIPREQIADFSKLKGAKKEEAMEALRKGTIRIGIGSTDKLGTGVNVQDRITAMHHLDVPWLPASVEQRDGRGHRSGNKNTDVDVFRYVSEGSLDQTFWQIVGNKASFIKQVITPGGNLQRVVKDEDTEELTPQQLMAAASGDPRIMEKVNLDEDIKQLRAAESRHQREQAKFQRSIPQSHADLERLKQMEELQEQEQKHFEKYPDFHFEIGGEAHTDRKKAEEAFEAAKARAEEEAPENDKRGQFESEIGTFRGMKLVRKGPKGGARYYLNLPTGTMGNPSESLKSVEAVARNMAKSDRRPEIAKKRQSVLSDLEKLQASIGKPFPKAKDLAEKLEQSKRLEGELADESTPTATPTVQEPPPAAAESISPKKRKALETELKQLRQGFDVAYDVAANDGGKSLRKMEQRIQEVEEQLQPPASPPAAAPTPTVASSAGPGEPPPTGADEFEPIRAALRRGDKATAEQLTEEYAVARNMKSFEVHHLAQKLKREVQTAAPEPVIGPESAPALFEEAPRKLGIEDHILEAVGQAGASNHELHAHLTGKLGDYNQDEVREAISRMRKRNQLEISGGKLRPLVAAMAMSQAFGPDVSDAVKAETLRALRAMFPLSE